MFEVIYMKADFEPWWMFDGWEENIVEKYEFENLTDANAFLIDFLTKLREKYDCEATKNNRFWAFWSEDEVEYCEPCGDDLQIYHGVIMRDTTKHIEGQE